MIYLADGVPTLLAHRIASSWIWYLIRASGFVSAGLLVLLVISGIGQVTGFIYRLFEPLVAWTIHRALAIALCVSVAIHGGSLLFDKYMPFSLPAVLVPFWSHYSNGTSALGLPLGSLGVGFGVLAMYAIAVVVATSLLWMKSKAKTWRLLHYLSYLIAGLVFFHALYVGTDLKYGAFREVWMALGLVVAVGIVWRIWRAGTLKTR